MLKKAIVETVGPFMYIDPHTGFVIESDRPVVATVTAFLSQKIADGIITLLVPNLPKEADDKEFAEYLEGFKGADNGTNSAIASYVSKFGMDETGHTTGKPVTVPDYTDENKTDEELLAELEAEEAANKLLEPKQAEVKELEPKQPESKLGGLFNKKAK